MRAINAVLAAILLFIWTMPAQAQSMQNLLGRVTGIVQGQKQEQAVSSGTGAEAGTSLTNGEMRLGLKTALDQAIKYAIAQLGTTDGFLRSKIVRIPMPQELQQVGESEWFSPHRLPPRK